MYLVLTANSAAMQNKADVTDMWTAVHAERDEFSFVADHLRKTTVPSDYRIDIELDFAEMPHRLLPWSRLDPMLTKLGSEVMSQAHQAKLAVSFRSRSQTLPSNNHLRIVGAAVLRTAERYNGVVLDLLTRRAYTPASFRRALNQDSDTLGESIVTKRRVSDQHFVLLSRGQIKLGLPDFVIGPFATHRARTSQDLIAQVRSDLRADRADYGRVIIYKGEKWTYSRCPNWNYDGECRYLMGSVKPE
ncbi:MAG: hypothetical protein VYA30_08500 [Myxococcota bacterium]|nr:hypothetical protein [Myxococcota bacterium]